MRFFGRPQQVARKIPGVHRPSLNVHSPGRRRSWAWCGIRAPAGARARHGFLRSCCAAGRPCRRISCPCRPIYPISSRPRLGWESGRQDWLPSGTGPGPGQRGVAAEGRMQAGQAWRSPRDRTRARPDRGGGLGGAQRRASSPPLPQQGNRRRCGCRKKARRDIIVRFCIVQDARRRPFQWPAQVTTRLRCLASLAARACIPYLLAAQATARPLRKFS